AASCSATDTDFAIYEGTMGDFNSHLPVFCSTGGATALTFTPAAESTYYLVVPKNLDREGSYGTGKLGAERPRSDLACLLQATGTCP
ncbi:MAG: hypothetical protein O6947_00595, partial [Acidobacteria bacterium]|nr:hypothetical protein [Acidobacteriota bacterium]